MPTCRRQRPRVRQLRWPVFRRPSLAGLARPPRTPKRIATWSTVALPPRSSSTARRRSSTVRRPGRPRTFSGAGTAEPTTDFVTLSSFFTPNLLPDPLWDFRPEECQPRQGEHRTSLGWGSQPQSPPMRTGCGPRGGPWARGTVPGTGPSTSSGVIGATIRASTVAMACRYSEGSSNWILSTPSCRRAPPFRTHSAAPAE